MKKTKGHKAESAFRSKILSGSSRINSFKKLSTSELIELYAYSEAIIETVREPLIILDQSLHVKTANKAFFDTFLTTKEETYGKYIYDLKGGDWNIAELKRLLEEIIPKNTVFNDYEVKHDFRKIGYKIMLLNARRIVLEGNKTQMILLAMEDVTEKRKLEQIKEDFLSIASHELKTPLTTMKAYAQILEKRLNASMDDKENTHFAARINRQADKMVSIIHDILDANRMEERGIKLTKKKFNLEKLVKNIAEDLQHTTEGHRISVDGSIGSDITADKERIGQVLVNFLANAIKYSPRSRQIEVVMKEEGHNALVSVRDYGMGISKDKQARIFDRYYRVREEGEKPGAGFGLGLYISSEIVKRHGGKVGVQSTPGKGSTFWFSLPLQ